MLLMAKGGAALKSVPTWVEQVAAALKAPALPVLPTTHAEEWHYTNLRNIYALPTEPDSISLRAIAASVPVVVGPQFAFVNGHPREDLTLLQGLAASVTVTVAEKVAALPEIKDELDTWHAALPGETVEIVAASGESVLHVMHVVAGHGLPVGGTVTVKVASGAELTLVEHFVGVPGSARWMNPRLVADIAKGGKLKHVVVQDVPLASVLTRRGWVEIGDKAGYEGFTLQTGGVLTRLETMFTCGKKTDLKLTGLNLTHGAENADGSTLNQTHDVTVRVLHMDEAPGSHIRQRNIVSGDDGDGAVSGHAVFQGKFYVAPKAQKTDAYMLCQSLLLNAGARASHKPELEIYADDVRCSHGASTGSLNPDQLFYLAARGIPDATARQLLVQAFADELVRDFPEPARALVATRVGHWLHGWAHGDSGTGKPMGTDEIDLKWLDDERSEHEPVG